MHPLTQSVQSGNRESGFVMLLVIMTALAFSLFAAAQIMESGQSLISSQATGRANQRLEAHRVAATFCAQIAIRNSPTLGAGVTTKTFDSSNIDLRATVNQSMVSTSLEKAVVDGSASVDAASDGNASVIRTGMRPNGTLEPSGFSWFFDPDYVGDFKAKKTGVGGLSGNAGSGGTPGGGALTDCSVSVRGCESSSGGSSTQIVNADNSWEAGILARSNYAMMPCAVYMQQNQFLTGTESGAASTRSFDATKPFRRYVVSYRHNTVSATGDRL